MGLVKVVGCWGYVLEIGGGSKQICEQERRVEKGAGKELTVLRFCCLIIAYSNCIVETSLAIV